MEGDWSAPPSTLPVHVSNPVSQIDEHTPANPYQHERYSKFMLGANPLDFQRA